MFKRNYNSKNVVDAELIFNDVLDVFNKIEKIKKKDDDNVAGVLFHELMYFFVSNICRSNLSDFLNIIDNNPQIKFGKRNNKDIFKLKKNSFLVSILFKFYNFLSYFLKSEKKLFLSKSISLDFKRKITLVLFGLFNGYKIILIDFKDIKMNLSEQVEHIFFEEIKKLLIKYKIDLRNLNDLKLFVKKIKTEKKFKYKNTYKSIIVSGTLADIQNRLLAIKKKKINARLLTVNHIPTYGVVSYKTLKYDEFYLCDYYLTSSKTKKILNDNNYIGIDKQNYKIINLENKNIYSASDFVKKINFRKLKYNKILYIPNRTANTSLTGKDYLYKKNYEEWQNFLASKLGKIDAKFPHKKTNYKINKKFNVLDTNLRLLQICNNYDLLIIDYISSTTFSEVAGSNVPILYFNLNRDDINKDAYKFIKSRVHEIKINIFDNFKGFEKVKKLGKKNERKNIFKTTYLNTDIKKSFYQNLNEIDREIKI